MIQKPYILSKSPKLPEMDSPIQTKDKYKKVVKLGQSWYKVGQGQSIDILVQNVP